MKIEKLETYFVDQEFDTSSIRYIGRNRDFIIISSDKKSYYINIEKKLIKILTNFGIKNYVDPSDSSFKEYPPMDNVEKKR